MKEIKALAPPQSLIPPPPPPDVRRLPGAWMLTRTAALMTAGRAWARDPRVGAACGLSPGIRCIFPRRVQLLWNQGGAGAVQERRRPCRCQVEEDWRGKKRTNSHATIGFGPCRSWRGLSGAAAANI